MKTKRILRFLLVLVFSVSALAATLYGQTGTTITVDTADDVIGGDGLCSLREAIVAANTDSPFQDCPGGSGADTIVLSPGLPEPALLTLAIGGIGEDSALTGDLDLVGELVISATNPAIIDGSGLDRIFEILPGARVTISGLTIRHGDPGAGAHGGGLAIAQTAALTLTHSTVISNTASRGGGIKVLGRLNLSDATVDANQGDGVHVDGGAATLSNVLVRDNGSAGIRTENIASLTFVGGTVSGNQGGGVYNSASNVVLSYVSVVSNTGISGVFSAGSGTRPAVLAMSACTISDNRATNGGGILSQGINARATIYDTDISGNTATSAGGGVFNNGLMTLNGSTIHHNRARSGGGIDHFGGNLYMTNDTLTGNDASDNGGGLHNRSSSILTNVTFNGNTADGPETGGNIFVDTGALSIVNSIVADSPTDGNCFVGDGFLNSLGHNLESADTCGFDATGDLTNSDPHLGPLQDNGGPTRTHALLSDSPAIGAGDNSACPDTDQRGVPRPQGTTCDMGAYEATDVSETADLSIDKTRVGTGTVVSGEQITYTLGLSNAGPAAPVSAVVVDTWSPAAAVVSVDAPGCTVDLVGGVLTCPYAALELGKLTPEPMVVLTTDPTFTGVLSNTATIAPTGSTIDVHPANNTSQTISVTIARDAPFKVYLPLIANNSTTPTSSAGRCTSPTAASKSCSDTD